MEENDITAGDFDQEKLKHYTIQVEALFKCRTAKCDNAWSSHMATIKVDLYKCKVDKSDCEQRCRKCPDGWVPPNLTEDRFKEAIDRVIAKFWERKNENGNDDDDDDDDDSIITDNRHRGNPRAPHEESLCKRCIKLGRPCW